MPGWPDTKRSREAKPKGTKVVKATTPGGAGKSALWLKKANRLVVTTIHSLRHTFATTLAEKGVHPSTAQKMLGHSDIRMTLAIYTHATDDMQDAATAALEEAFS